MINRNVLLISESAVKETSILNDNCYGKYLLPSIQYAQEAGLQAILGTCLYEKIIEMVADGTISLDVSAAYKELLDNYIQPYLVNKTLAETIVNVSAKVANIGSVISNDEHVSNLSQKDLELLRNTYVERSDFYEKRMQDFLKENRAAFPELNCPCGTLKPNLEASTNSVGVWLGGMRGRKISTSKCGCSESSSTPSGGDYADGYRDGFVAGRASGITEGENIQRGKLVSTAITENGVYERYDGFSAVDVNVPQTGHTDQELEDAYASGYTSGYSSGYTRGDAEGYQSGVTHQKSLLTSLNVTQNGSYERENGYSAITVNVSGQAPTLTTTAVTQNGEYSAPQGYDGFSSFDVNVPQTGHTDQELQDAYTSGYSSGYSSGETHQKSLMISTAITANTTVSRADGFSSVTVNVPTGTSGNKINISNTVYLNEYGRYYFDYNSATTLPSMEIVFATSPTPPTPPPTPTGETEQYLTFDVLNDGDIVLYNDNSQYNIPLSYSVNGGNWVNVTTSPYETHINLNSGDKVRFKGENQSYYHNAIKFNTNVNIHGNIMSLIYGDNFIGELSVGENALRHLFKHNYGQGIVNASGLVLPATSLGANCYAGLFDSFASLLTAPTILPATTLEESCYMNMFYRCTSLTTAPELPATTLKKMCYNQMFMSCSSLQYVKCLATDISASSCTTSWLYGVSSTGTFVKNANMNDWTVGVNAIPLNWTVVDA